MEATKLSLLLDFPFFGSLAMRLPLVADSTINTFQVNGVDIKYNPAYVKTLNRSQKMFAYIHEIMHVILGHFERQGNRDRDLWNIATDFAVNQIIPEEHGVRQPEGILVDPMYDGKSAEEIYTILADDYEQIAREGGVDPGSDDGDNPGESDTAGPGDVAQNAANIRANGDHQAEDFDASDTLRAEFESLIERSRQFGEVVDPPPESDVSAEGMRGAAVMVAQLMDADGNYIPDQIKKLVYTITDTRLPWAEFLSQFLHESCMSNYNWMRPNMRYMSASDFIFPSLQSNDAMTLAVVIDSSGSVNRHYLSKFMSEFFALIASINYKSLTILICDDQVLSDSIIYHGQQFDGSIHGGNATKFSPAFAKITEMPVQPACLVYFTDLGSDDFGPPPPYPVMWVGNYTEEWEEAHRKRVPFGQVLSMRE